MLTIWKFPFRIDDSQDIEMPAGARILAVDVQNGHPTMWALVDPKERIGKRRVRIFGTGHSVPEHIADLDHYRHEGTILTHRDGLVWHVFVSLSTFLD